MPRAVLEQSLHGRSLRTRRIHWALFKLGPIVAERGQRGFRFYSCCPFATDIRAFPGSAQQSSALRAGTRQAPWNGRAALSLLAANRRKAPPKRRERLHLALYDIDRRVTAPTDCGLVDYAKHFLMSWRNLARSLYLITNTDCFAWRATRAEFGPIR